MRILFYTGKGGTGKTSIAAATAVYLARRGKKVLIMSADQAHSLGDAFRMSFRNGITPVEENLDALEVNPVEESRRAWGNLRDYLRQIIRDKADGGLAVDEALVFPGLEELFSLLRILEICDEDAYEALIVDCAPTGETLSLLRYPERLSVLADSILPQVRSMNRAFGGLISRKTTVPKPRDEVFAEFERLVKELSRLREILQDRQKTSIRIVASPERIVLDEARRSFSWLQLYDFGVDAAFMNRVFPEEALRGYFDAWIPVQEESLRIFRESFPDRKLFFLELKDRELRGADLLSEAAESMYGEEDPLRIYCAEEAFRMEDEMGTRKFIVRLPHMEEEDIEVLKDQSDLILRLRNETRRFHLPDRLSRRYVSGWTYDGKELCIRMDYD